MARLHLTTAQRLLFAGCLALLAYALFAPGLAFAGEAALESAVSTPAELAHFGATGLVGLYSWVSSGQRVMQTEHSEAKAELGRRIASNRDALEKRLGEVERRLAVAEEAARHAPTAAQITQLMASIGEMRGDLRAQSTKIEGLTNEVHSVRTSFGRYENHLLEKGL